jgi:large subunit ribosomal protein L22
LEAKAHLRYVRISPRKARLVVDMIRGMDTTEAKAVLNFVPKKAARIVKKLLESAISNAVKNHGMKEENLYISKIYVDKGPTLKRWKPRARGRADRILKRTSHITIYVSQREGS